MKERGKSVESDSNYFSSSSDLLCKKHPLNSSSVGICAYCLQDRLMKLICSDCGDQRLSSCTFSEKKTLLSHMKTMEKSEKESEGVVLIKRSNSCVVEVKKSNGFWRIGKLFKKKREKVAGSERNGGGFDLKSDVSRSRSLSSFMDGKYEVEIGSMACSSAKVSDFSESDPRKSGIRGGLMDFRSGFMGKDTDFSRMDDDDDDDEFIDLKIDLSDNSTRNQCVSKNYDPPEIKKLNNSDMKTWKCIFKHHSGKKDLNHILQS